MHLGSLKREQKYWKWKQFNNCIPMIDSIISISFCFFQIIKKKKKDHENTTAALPYLR